MSGVTAMRTLRLEIATKLCAADDPVDTRNEMIGWDVAAAILADRGCLCVNCATGTKVAALAAAGYRARYMELMEVA